MMQRWRFIATILRRNNSVSFINTFATYKTLEEG
jgi:hypothetical protein